ILPRHRFEELGKDDFKKELAHKPIGNGPFRLDGEISDERIVLRRWDQYRPRPYVAAMIFHCIPATQREKRVRMLVDDKIDEAELNASEFRWDINGKSFSKRLRKIIKPRTAYDYICWNVNGSNAALFSDARIRRAIAYALDVGRLRQ